jgi:hypothetical protein
MDVTWPSTSAANAGSGKIDIWNRTKLSPTGNNVAGDDTQSCGTRLPEFNLNPLAGLITGGSKVLIEIPDSDWDATTMPKFHSQGVLGGWDPGNTVKFDPTVALVGLTMADPMAAWPENYDQLQAADADNDSKAGFTAAPHAGSGYTAPPVALFGAKTDKIYLASRTIVGLDGQLSSCEDIAGTAIVKSFDSHVVGCHIKDKDDCQPGDIGFVDKNRTIYEVKSATFTAKKIAEGATCADVRTALP